MEAELSRAGEYVGVVVLSEDGVSIDLEDPAHREQVEQVFREAGPHELLAGYAEGELHWRDFSLFGDHRWFERVLRSLGPLGYTFETTKTDSG